MQSGHDGEDHAPLWKLLLPTAFVRLLLETGSFVGKGPSRKEEISSADAAAAALSDAHGPPLAMGFGDELEELGVIYGEGYASSSHDEIVITLVVNRRRVILSFAASGDYPASPPVIGVEVAGATDSRCEEMLRVLATEMIGVPMLFYLVSAAVDHLKGLGASPTAQAEQASHTPFTRERFLLWLQRFEGERGRDPGVVGEKQLSGKEIFERGLAGA